MPALDAYKEFYEKGSRLPEKLGEPGVLYLIGELYRRLGNFREARNYYGKALFGWGKMNFQYNFAYGRFADIALGGGVDYDLSKRISVRVADFEYQLWPNWVNGTLKPYGGSIGVAYKIF